MTDEELDFRFRTEKSNRNIVVFWLALLMFMIYMVLRAQIFEMDTQMQSMHYRLHKLEETQE